MASYASPTPVSELNTASGSLGGDALSPDQRKQIYTPAQKWDDDRAKKIALADFNLDSGYRQRMHDRRFKTSDELYLAWVQKRTWEGTKIPRSSIGIFTALEQVEGMLPQVVNNLFGDQEPFGVDPEPSTTMAAARNVYHLLRYQLQDVGEEGLIAFREVMVMVLKQALVYGNGIAELGWMMKTITRLMWERYRIPIKTPYHDPMSGQMGLLPTGKFHFYSHQVPHDEHINKPLILPLDIRDFYIDQNCNSHLTHMAKHCSIRQWKPISWIVENCTEANGFKKYSAADLIELSNKKFVTEGDNSKAQTEIYRGNSWRPEVDSSTDPEQRQIEIIRYYTRDREIWLYSRELARNVGNELGQLPVFGIPFIEVPGRWYGLSICDLVEGDQRLAEALINSRIDELSLMIHSPIIVKRGSQQSQSDRRLRPGLRFEVDDMKDAPQRMEMGNVTAQAFIEVEALERRVQRATGNSDLAVLGSPTQGGNSANRTAAGINVQRAATSTRIEYLVDNIAHRFMIPILNGVLSLNQRYLDADEIVNIVGPDGAQLQIDPIEVLNASVRFRIDAASKMRSRVALQSMLPWLVQTFMNPVLMQQASVQGLKLDFGGMLDLIGDSVGLHLKELWQPLDPQTMQMMQTPSPKDQLAAQTAHERHALQAHVSDQRNETQLLTATLGELVKNPRMQQELTGVPHPDAQPQPVGE